MKLLLSLLIFIFCQSVFGQSDCPTPALQKIMPGMTVKEVQKQIGRTLKLKQNPEFKFVPEAKTALVKNIKGVRSLLLSFYQSRVLSIDVYYDDSVRWDSFLEFAEISAKNLLLPVDKLNYVDDLGRPTNKLYARTANLKCGSFFLSIHYSYWGYSLGVIDVDSFHAAEKENKINIEKNRQKNEIKKKVFRP